jgi:hypothetical protein
MILLTLHLEGLRKEIMNSFKPFSLVQKPNTNIIYVVVLGPLKVPFFKDGLGSEDPIDFEDPNEWSDSFVGYLCWNTLVEDYEVINANNLRVFIKDTMNAHIPFDHGKSRLRGILGLIRLAEKMNG